MTYRMKEPSIIRGTQKHTDAIETQRSASGISPVRLCDTVKWNILHPGFYKHHGKNIKTKIKSSLWHQKLIKKKNIKKKIRENRKLLKNNKNTGWSNSRTLPSTGSSKINKYTE